MTMARMVEYLENRGFKVEKVYNAGYRRYEFSIFKHGIETQKNFEYPSFAKDTPEMDKIQVEFLESLIKEWESVKSNVDDICGPEAAKYIDTDIAFTKRCKEMLNSIYGKRACARYVPSEKVCMPAIKDVIFNNPATIVFWVDGSKTVVKCQDGDVFDPEKGLAMAISKKALGNKYSSYNVFKKWLKKAP